MGNQAGVTGAGLTLLTVTTDPQPVPVGNGVTLVNSDKVPVTLSKDNPPTPANSSTLAPNGASKPIPSGDTVFISVATGTATIEIIPGLFNIFNPNVLSIPPADVDLLTAPIVSGTSQTFTVTIQPSIQTLVILLENQGNDPPLSISVTGNESFIIYYDEPPYFERVIGVLNQKTFCLFIVPITSQDTEVTIQITWSSDPVTGEIIVNGAYDRYTESTLYTGHIKGASQILTTPGSATIVGGSCRLLTAQLTTTAATEAYISLDGNNMLHILGSGSGSLTFPENTRLGFYSSLALTQVGAGEAIGSVTFAYP